MRDPDGDGPTRTCIATRAERRASEMIRFVAAPDGTVTPDLRRKLPGRGVWVTASEAAVADAVKKKAFARALKAPVTTPEDLPGLVGQLLRTQALQALALANKAGAVVCGAAKIEGGAGRGFAALLHAAEASPNGIEKLERAVRGRSRDGVAIPAIRLFTGDELSLSLGREHVIHAALVTGAPAGNVLARVRAAERYRHTSAAPAQPSVPDGQGNAGIRISTKDSDPDE